MNARAHILAGIGFVGGVLLWHEVNNGQRTHWPITGAVAGGLFTNLPDVLEPALHPNHRQFFHSWTFAAVLLYSLKRLCEFQPTTPEGVLGRKLAMAAIGGYLVHLALDSTTAKSLPLVVK